MFPRTVCKREITRDEAEYYIKNERTKLLQEFTSRFGRPFAATLVLTPNGRHGFEFQPRAAGVGGRKKAAAKAGSKKSRQSKRAKTAKQAKTRKKASKRKAKKKTATKAGSHKQKAAPRK